MNLPHLTTVDHAAIWEKYREGMNPNEIAHATGRAYHTVASLIKSNGGIRPPVRTRAGLRLSLADREEISRGLRARETYTVIAGRIGRATSTVSREVARNGGRQGYRAHRADKAADLRALRPKPAKLTVSTSLCQVVTAKLEAKWSPEQIAGWLRLEHPDDPGMWISPETIYVSVYRGVGGLKPGLYECFRSSRPRRRPRRRGRSERRGKNPNMVMITERPTEAEDRVQPGHWEGDLVYGCGHRRAIGTLVERTSRYLILLDLVDGFDTERMHSEFDRHLVSLPEDLRRTLTWDQGTEMSGHQAFTASTGIPVYFCHARSPWQRGTNENTNGLLRQYFPRGVDLRHITRTDLDRVAAEMNNRPRRILDWQTPTQRLHQLTRALTT